MSGRKSSRANEVKEMHNNNNNNNDNTCDHKTTLYWQRSIGSHHDIVFGRVAVCPVK